ncbi:hypothetical protein [Kitasatospora camelliae]|uniref:Secreted protein n=1 Tax=Kitasatospora camelliae TaxID=3156397 RepID=A0AAU8JWE0_9ACTN
MRATWTAVALTAALSLTTVTGATATIASAADPAPAVHILPAIDNAPPPAVEPELPAPADPAKSLDALGALGNVLALVKEILATATPSAGVPDPGELQKQVDELNAAVQDLLSKLPAGATAPQRSIPGSGTVPAAAKPGDALARVQRDVEALVTAATAAKRDPEAVMKAVPTLSTDTVAATSVAVTALTPAH